MMYHFVASSAPEPLTLSEEVQVPGHIRQYLREFQVETIQFLFKHFANGDFAILNDESGLGKCVATTVLLGAVGKSKRCLVVVQNDDKFVTGWQFHLNILTKLSVADLEDNKCCIDPLPNITIAKWATIRSIGDISKYNFDFIVLDNRGEMLNNNFCTSMLLNNFEHKVNLFISSVDVTSDIKFLHNVLRLGGRLEHRYSQFKAFEAKFNLPDSKEVLSRRVSLDVYFLRREMLSNYCKEFRLRRHCYQYEDKLPLVDVDRYKISLDLWRTIGSSGSMENINKDGHSEMLTEELFQNQPTLTSEISILEKIQEAYTDGFTNQEMSDDEDMSPLVVDSDSYTSSDVESLPHDECNISCSKESTTPSEIYEFVDLSIEEDSPRYNNNVSERNGNKQNKEQNVSNGNFIEIFESNISVKGTEPEKSNNGEIDQVCDGNTMAIAYNETSKLKKLNTEKTQHIGNSNQIKNEQSPQRVTRSSIKADENRNVGRRTKSKSESLENQMRYAFLRTKGLEQRQLRNRKEKITEQKPSTLKEKTNTKKTDALLAKKRKRDENIEEKQPLKKRLKRMTDLDKPKDDFAATKKNETAAKGKNLVKKLEVENKSIVTKKNEKGSPAKNQKKMQRKEPILPSLIRTTRGMQRMTRHSESVKASKYMTSLPGLTSERKVKKVAKNESKIADKTKNTLPVNKATKKNTNKREVKETKKDNKQKDKLSDSSILSFSDCDEIQCGQTLVSDTIAEQNLKDGFLVPPTPPRHLRQTETNKIYLPTPSSSLESDVIFIPPSIINDKNQQIVQISSSPEDGSISSFSSQSRRTRALKQNRVIKSVSTRSNNRDGTSATFGELLSIQQGEHNQRKSPDIFTVSTDLDLTCTQRLAADLGHQQRSDNFQGFKIFGSEVKQFQQQHATFHATVKQKVNRSCLTILEKMFDPKDIKNANENFAQPENLQQEHEQISAGNLLKKNTRRSKNVVPTLPNSDAVSGVLKSTKKNQKETKTNANRQTDEPELFEITNNEVFGSLMLVNSSGEVSPVQSGKGTQNGQCNKITNYLTQRMLTEAQVEVGERLNGNVTPSRPQQQLYSNLVSSSSSPSISRRSPKQLKPTQTTKLTKWFRKNDAEPQEVPNVQEKKKPSMETEARASPSIPAKQTRKSTMKNSNRKRVELCFRN